MGGVAGSAAGEAMDPTVEDTYWRGAHQPYYKSTQNTYPDLDYDRDYRHAYRVGYEDSSAYDSSKRFEDVEPDLRTKWEQSKAESRLSWDEAKYASRDAWNRLRPLVATQQHNHI